MRSVFLVSLFWITHLVGFAQHSAYRQLKLMGTRFEIQLVHEDSSQTLLGVQWAIEEIQRIEQMISSWDSSSYTSKINQMAGIRPVKVPEEMFQLIQRAQKVSQLTQGAFSLAFASVYDLYQFNNFGFELPSQKITAPFIPLTNYENILLNKEEKTVFLRLPKMKIGFGAIGKGYAADKVKALLLDKGFKNGCINASGDLTAWGHNSEGNDWQIGITDPRNTIGYIAQIPVRNKAIVTSGDYEKFFTFNGVRYSHIIDPRTCRPAKEIASATVLCASAELADALATAVCVIGKENGLQLINKLEGIEAIIIDQHGKRTQTKNVLETDY